MLSETAILIPPKDLLLNKFWKRFNLFATTFEEFSFRYWYFVMLGFGLALAVLDINLDLRQGIDLPTVFASGGNMYGHLLSLTSYDLTTAPLLLGGIALSCVALTFTLWCRRVPGWFQQLYTLGRICSYESKSGISQREYVHFLVQYQRALVSRRRYLILGIFLLLMVGLMLVIILPRIVPFVSGFGSDRLYEILSLVRWPLLLIIFAGVAIAYYAALGFWILTVTGWFMVKLTAQFYITSQPRHPDRCGGLRLLGTFCLGLAIPFLTSSVFLGIYGIFLVLSEKSTSLLVVAINLLLFLVMLPLAAVFFFAPLWNTHRRMLGQRVESDEDCSELVATLETKLRSSLHNGVLDKAREAKEGLDLTQALYPRKAKYPLWPFDSRIFLVYLLPQLVPLIGLLVAINANGLLANALRDLWSIFTGHSIL